jgi:hypothetical protein
MLYRHLVPVVVVMVVLPVVWSLLGPGTCCRRLLAPAIHPASSGSQGWARVLVRVLGCFSWSWGPGARFRRRRLGLSVIVVGPRVCCFRDGHYNILIT